MAWLFPKLVVFFKLGPYFDWTHKGIHKGTVFILLAFPVSISSPGWHLQRGADLRRSACCFVGGDHLREIGQFGCDAGLRCLGNKNNGLGRWKHAVDHVDATWMLYLLYLCLWYISRFLPLFCVTNLSLFILISFLMVIFQISVTDLHRFAFWIQDEPSHLFRNYRRIPTHRIKKHMLYIWFTPMFHTHTHPYINPSFSVIGISIQHSKSSPF